MAEAESETRVCRICFDGADSGQLVSPCGCSGTQALVHDSCLQRWRRIQLLQGKLAAAQKCEICGQKYSDSLEAPRRPLSSRTLDFLHVLTNSYLHLVFYLVDFGSLSGFHILVLAVGLVCGIWKIIVFSTIMFPPMVLFLYCHGCKLSVLGTRGRAHLGITSFGPPVEGLSRGMLLVSLGARGAFAKTVLYVEDHDDNGSLALILNGPIEDVRKISTPKGDVTCCLRSGGPVLLPGMRCIHDMRSDVGGERIGRERRFFLCSGITSLQKFVQNALKHYDTDEADRGRALFIKDVASWGPHQLAGEARRWAWGWIRPEHVKLADIFDAPGIVNVVVPPGEEWESVARARETFWEKFVNSPHLEVFQA